MNNIIMRDIRIVIKQMKEYIPEIENPFYGVLDRIQKDSYFRAPECMYLSWVELTDAIASKFQNHPTQDWHFEILSIFTLMPIHIIKEASRDPQL